MGESESFATKPLPDPAATIEAIAGGTAAAGATARVRGPAKAGTRASTGKTTNHARILVFVMPAPGSVEPALYHMLPWVLSRRISSEYEAVRITRSNWER